MCHVAPQHRDRTVTTDYCDVTSCVLSNSGILTAVVDVLKGCFAHGLYLEGAAWDVDSGTIFKQRPKQLIQPLPVLKIIPIETHRLKLQVRSSEPECYKV